VQLINHERGDVREFRKASNKSGGSIEDYWMGEGRTL